MKKAQLAVSVAQEWDGTAVVAGAVAAVADHTGAVRKTGLTEKRSCNRSQKKQAAVISKSRRRRPSTRSIRKLKKSSAANIVWDIHLTAPKLMAAIAKFNSPSNRRGLPSRHATDITRVSERKSS